MGTKKETLGQGTWKAERVTKTSSVWGWIIGIVIFLVIVGAMT